MSMKAYILRGLPGSGKSTFTKTLDNAVVASADNFFMKDGRYEFNPSLLGDAHKACLRLFVETLRAGKDVVCDNTNTTHFDMAAYVQVALALGADVEIHTFLVSPEVSFSRNTHGVPRNVIDSMNDKLRRSFEMPFLWSSIPTFLHGSAPGFP